MRVMIDEKTNRTAAFDVFQVNAIRGHVGASLKTKAILNPDLLVS